jgi:hypothetical protein
MKHGAIDEQAQEQLCNVCTSGVLQATANRDVHGADWHSEQRLSHAINSLHGRRVLKLCTNVEFDVTSTLQPKAPD